MRCVLALCLALVVTGCGRRSEVSHVDLTIRQRVTSGAQPYEEVEYLTATRRIIDNPHERSIVDLPAQTLTTIDKDKQTYWTVTFDELRREDAAQQKRLEDAPFEVKALLDPPVALNSTGRHDRMLGYDAEEYVFSGGELTGSVWVTAALAAPMEGPEWDRFIGATASQSAAGKLAEQLTKLEGLPLRATWTTVIGEHRSTIAIEVLEVQKRSPPPEVAVIPPGFQKIDSPLLQD